MKVFKKALAAAFITAGIAGTCVFASVTISSNLSSDTPVIGDPVGSDVYCKPTSKKDCKSPATGNIYINYYPATIKGI
ncbi:MAG: hypothetical protein AAFW00_18695 [Bacteroidota bacterium]